MSEALAVCIAARPKVCVAAAIRSAAFRIAIIVPMSEALVVCIAIRSATIRIAIIVEAADQGCPAMLNTMLPIQISRLTPASSARRFEPGGLGFPQAASSPLSARG